MAEKDKVPFMGRIHRSLIAVVIGICLLFSSAILVTLIAPRHVDPTWMEPSSYYQKQMFEVADPNFYISSEATGVKELQYVNHLRNGESILAFEEDERTRIIAPKELERYVTRFGEKDLILTKKLLMLRAPKGEIAEKAKELSSKLQENTPQFSYEVLELYQPERDEAFSVSYSDGVIEDFVDSNFVLLDSDEETPGHIYVKNPQEYRISPFGFGDEKGFKFDPEGEPVQSLEELRGKRLGFRSRKELIELGESIFRIEGCWYCHTMQTRTLVEDVVLNGSELFPAPPSSPNEYIYEKTTFPGTRRIGPDLSRVGIKKPGRDWHKAHFWAPKTASAGSIMPSYRHFFDFDPRGSRKSVVGIPNFQFEAVYQYLMTKGTRITPPTEAWWLGKDPVNTLEIIEGRK